MPVTYPAALDSLSNPLASDPTLNPGNVLDHANQHTDVNDLLEALQAKVGINGSAVTSSLDYKISTHQAATTGVHGITGSVVGTSDTQTLTGKTISGAANTLTAIPQASVVGAPAGAFVGTSDTQTLTGKTISGANNTLTNIPKASVVGAPAGAFVGDTDSQTLTGKTISGASNTLSNIPQASVTGAPAGAFVGTSDTQTLTNKTISGASNTLSNIPQSAVTGLTAALGAIPQSSVTGLAAALALYTPIIKQKGTNQSVTSNISVQNDADIVFTLAAGRTYRVSAFLEATGAAAGDLRTMWAVSGTVSALTSRSCIGPGTGSTTVAGDNVRTSRAILTTEVTYGTDGTATPSAVYEDFLVSGGASGGTLTLRWAQGTSSGTSTVLTTNTYAEARPVI